MKSIVLTFFMVFCTFSYAQQQNCKVIISKGAVQYQVYDIPEWTDVTSGTEIIMDCNVKIGTRSSLIIMDDNGTTLQLNKPGTYKLKELLQSRNKKNSNQLLKFGRYIKEQLFSNKSDKSLPGAVERSLYLVNLLRPLEGKFINPEVNFSWTSLNENSVYTFYLLDSYGTNIYTTQLSDTLLKLNLQNLGLITDQIYSWYVTADVDSIISKERYIILSTDAGKIEYSKYEKEFLEENKELDSFSFLMLALYFQQNDVVDKAEEYFKKAIEKDPDIDEYKELYNMFTSSKR